MVREEFPVHYGISHARLGTVTCTGSHAVAMMMPTIVHCTRENHRHNPGVRLLINYNTEKNDKTSQINHMLFHFCDVRGRNSENVTCYLLFLVLCCADCSSSLVCYEWIPKPNSMHRHFGRELKKMWIPFLIFKFELLLLFGKLDNWYSFNIPTQKSLQLHLKCLSFTSIDNSNIINI